MDPLVMTAASALVSSMATDAWEQARHGVLTLWQRVRPERVPAIEGELAEVREEVLAARQAEDLEAEEELVRDWQRRLQRLVGADPAVHQELRRVLDEVLTPLLSRSEASSPRTVTMHARAGDNSVINQAGRDMNIGR
ncbi:hypothetical protein ACF061_19230 [Streptomyces sp. NPDC015220]|uniref:hypothetical protein n=1 Tax=Streptomyces sp. NPDC015220 TaxID=3364947 RepID=UPI0036F9CB21